MIRKRRSFIVVLLLLSGVFQVHAQETEILKDPDALYKKGLELYKKDKFGSAQAMFSNAIEVYGQTKNDFRTNAEYYSALCAIELFNNDADT